MAAASHGSADAVAGVLLVSTSRCSQQACLNQESRMENDSISMRSEYHRCGECRLDSVQDVSMIQALGCELTR